MSQNATESIMQRDMQRLRKEALLRRVLDGLRHTIQLRALNPDNVAAVNEVRAELTDLSAVIIAPLIEALDVLENIIFASDGCVGHRDCAHSMEPWQRARALFAGKWTAENNCRSWPTLDCQTCDNYVRSASEAPFCPSCARERSTK